MATNIDLYLKDGASFNLYYPKTDTSQVEGLSTALAAKLNLTGGTMSGAINMGTYGITNSSGISSTTGAFGVTSADILNLSAASGISITSTTGSIDVNGLKITELGTPTVGTDATTKQYVDNLVAAGFHMVNSCYVATTANIVLSGTQTIDGISVALDNLRILVRSQTTTSENGIYLSKAATTWVKVTDDTEAGAATFIEEGTVSNNYIYVCDTNNTTWNIFAKPETITASGNLQRSGANITTVTNLSLASSTATTQARTDDSTKVATTAYVWDVIDTYYQPIDADLTAIAGLGFTATAFLKKTAANTWALDTNTYLTSGTVGAAHTILSHSDTTGSATAGYSLTYDSTDSKWKSMRKNRTYIQSTEPTDGYAGDIWFKTA